MKLIYQTSDVVRANKIVEVLGDNGINASVQGVHMWSIRAYGFVRPLTIWVEEDANERIASQVLEHFFLTESPPLDISNSKVAARSRWFWFLLALCSGCLLSVALISFSGL